MIEINTKNIDKCMRTVKRRLSGLRCDNSIKCLRCKKRININKDGVALVNGFGGLNWYHSKCKLTLDL